MNAEELRAYCLGLKGVEEGFPFDAHTLVFKVGGKLFLLLSLDAHPLRFNAKCHPELALALRAAHTSVLPGYHMNKQHWNTIVCDGSVPKQKLLEWVNHSYTLVFESLSKKIKQQIAQG